LPFDVAIFLAALGITTLEIVEASAVGLALYADSRKHIAFLYVALGILVVLVPTLILGSAISYLPIVAVRVVGATLLLYFGLRLVKSARRSVVRSRKGGFFTGEEFERGIMYTGFSVGAIEAFEAAIVLIGLLPNNFSSTIYGIASGMVVVVVSTFALRNQVRKVKQANMKVVVSALLLSFATFWYAEAVYPGVSDLVLIPLFVAFAFIVYRVANRPSGETVPSPTVPAKTETSKENPSS
jgi:uncharacterized membrane protein